ncbi:MAG: cytochrome c peroxidase [Bacteroidota bacterium]
MRKKIIIPFIFLGLLIVLLSSSFTHNKGYYQQLYHNNINQLNKELNSLYTLSQNADISNPAQRDNINSAINATRIKLKGCDFWLRYLEPVAYKKINGPLPVEWETEVFEKYETPYKREGAGLTLAYQYLESDNPSKDSLLTLIDASSKSVETYLADSITSQLDSYHHFFLCNRLFLLDLATIYTTGFECPDTKEIIPELNSMLQNTAGIYQSYNHDFPSHALQDDYLALYNSAISFVKSQPTNFEEFNHFAFIRDYINPLFKLNQQYIALYKVQSKSMTDYSLNDDAQSIFDKNLYKAQNTKGIYNKITDEKILAEIDSIGKLLFYDPILSGNNMRSCASCHKLDNYLADTSAATALQFNRKGVLKRNQPSLINSVYNHLLMVDGKDLTLLDQVKDVITNPQEMGSSEKEVIEKVMSTTAYKKALKKFASYTNEKETISIKNIASAITYFYSKYSNYYSPFDEAINSKKQLNDDVVKGFNIFMSKAQCGTCHFAPQFNGIKPPYIGNEFEVIGVPAAVVSKNLSADNGRFNIHAATETKNAFRTPTVRNAAFTKPYMHNGVYKTLEEVIDFYDAGGGAGKGIKIDNQTLASDSLHLSKEEKIQLVAFINSLTENIPFDTPPQNLPLSKDKTLNRRKVGGEY